MAALIFAGAFFVCLINIANACDEFGYWDENGNYAGTWCLTDGEQVDLRGGIISAATTVVVVALILLIPLVVLLTMSRFKNNPPGIFRKSLTAIASALAGPALIFISTLGVSMFLDIGSNVLETSLVVIISSFFGILLPLIIVNKKDPYNYYARLFGSLLSALLLIYLIFLDPF